MIDNSELEIAMEHAAEQRSRVVWAPSAVNGAAAVALSGAIGAADQPDTMLRLLLIPWLIFCVGIILGALAINQHRKQLVVIKRHTLRTTEVKEAAQQLIRAVDAFQGFSPNRGMLIIALGGEEKADNEIRAMWRGLKKAQDLADKRMHDKSRQMHNCSERDLPRLKQLTRSLWKLSWASFLAFAAGVAAIALSPWLRA